MIELKLHKTELWSIWSATMDKLLRVKDELKYRRILTAEDNLSKKRKLFSPAEKELVAEYKRLQKLWHQLDEEIDKIIPSKKDQK